MTDTDLLRLHQKLLSVLDKLPRGSEIAVRSRRYGVERVRRNHTPVCIVCSSSHYKELLYIYVNGDRHIGFVCPEEEWDACDYRASVRS